jgi:hypothetical protein
MEMPKPVTMIPKHVALAYSAAQKNDVNAFLKNTENLEPETHERDIILATRRLFINRPTPNLFGASDAEELESAI